MNKKQREYLAQIWKRPAHPAYADPKFDHLVLIDATCGMDAFNQARERANALEHEHEGYLFDVHDIHLL